MRSVKAGPSVTMCTAPLLSPPVSSNLAPTARSATPSPLMSADVTDVPNSSKFSVTGPFFILLWISTVSFAEPLEFISMTYTEPSSEPPASSLPAPTAMSGTPSPLMSPRDATDVPNLSFMDRLGPPFRLWAIFVVLSAAPLRFIVITYTAPQLLPRAQSSSPAPTAMSGTPSPLMSPRDATDVPNLSS